VIPALLAVPMVQSLVGGVVGGVMNAFAPSEPTAPSPATSTLFGTTLNRASAAIQAAPSATSSAGTLRADQLGQMSSTDLQSWAKGLTGRHVDVTDETGRTLSGIVGGIQQAGQTMALNIGGHVVSLSQIKQISWSSSAI
jgi:hypothetical protein